MSGNWMALLEMSLTFGIVFAFCFYELWKLKQYKHDKHKPKKPTNDEVGSDRIAKQ